MLGIEGTGVVLAYLLSILSTLICVVYGIVNWNKPPKDQAREIEKEIKWEKKDTNISEQL